MRDEVARYFLHPHRVHAGHDVQLLLGGEAAFTAMLAAIAGAEREILLETYIWEPDGVGRRFVEALIERAQAGVKVRAVMDAVGSFGFTSELAERMIAAGVQLAEFHPVAPWRRRSGLTVRDHRKLLIVDCGVAFLGGMNLSDDYAPQSWGGKGWHDVHMRLRGPAVRDCERLFAVTWRHAVDESLGPVHREPSANAGPIPAQVLGIDNRGTRRLIRKHYEHALKRAKKSILIMASYFIPDRGLRAILRKAVGRGVEVRVLLPHESDVPVVQQASRFTYATLLRAGVQIYEWLPGMLHAKALAVDGEWLAVGSYNLDYRSLVYNWEIVAALADEKLCSDFAADFERAVQRATKIEREAWRRRSWAVKLIQWLAYLGRRWL